MKISEIENKWEIFNIGQLKYFDIECQRDLRHLYYYIFQYLRSTTDMIFLHNIGKKDSTL